MTKHKSGDLRPTRNTVLQVCVYPGQMALSSKLQKIGVLLDAIGRQKAGS